MGARHPLPYAFAKANTLLLEDDGQQLVLWAAEGASLPALSEVLRLYEIDVMEHEAAATLVQRIAVGLRGQRIERGHGDRRGRERRRPESRMMQELPAIEDLLEASNDAPIIRMLNALLTQAAKDGASRHPHRALRAQQRGALPRRRHAARGGAAEQGAARGADLAPEDHGRARHRREAPAAGRPHLAAHRRARGRRARLHAAVVARRTRGAAPARQGRVEVHARRPGDERRRAGRVRQADPAAARHRARHRPHRLGQDDHAVRVAGPHRHRHDQRADGRGSGGVRARRHRPDAGQPEDRADLREGAARDPAPGPGRHHDRRDPRLRDRADRDPGLAHRPPGARHRAHQRRAEHDHADDRHGRRALPAQLVAARRARAAPGQEALPALQEARRAAAATTRSAAPSAARPATRAAPASTS